MTQIVIWCLDSGKMIRAGKPVISSIMSFSPAAFPAKKVVFGLLFLGIAWLSIVMEQVGRQYTYKHLLGKPRGYVHNNPYRPIAHAGIFCMVSPVRTKLDIVEDTQMDKMSLYCNESFMRSVYALTRRKKSGAVIATKLDSIHGRPGKPIIDSTITGVWARFGGQRAFLNEMQSRRKGRKSLAEPHSEKSEPKSLLTEEEMRILAKFARRLYWTQAIVQLRAHVAGQPLTVFRVTKFLEQECGSLTGFFEKYGEKSS